MDSLPARLAPPSADPTVATPDTESASPASPPPDGRAISKSAARTSRAAGASIGARVREARVRAGLSQGQLAAKAGLGSLTLSCWERGDKKPALSSLRLVAQALECSTADLLDPHGGGARTDGAATCLGANLRAAREAAGLTQATLALRMGAASSKAIERWESGDIEPTIAVLQRLAQTLHVSVRQLLLGSADAPDPQHQVSPPPQASAPLATRMKQDVAARLVAQRASLGLSREEFATRIGVSPTVVTRWELGRGLDLDGLVRCARCLGVSADTLLGLHDAIPPLARRLADAINAGKMPGAYLNTIDTLVTTATA